MSDTSHQQSIEKKFFEYLPTWAWGTLSIFVALGFVMNTLGLNFAAPLNIIAMAKADAYKAQILQIQTEAIKSQHTAPIVQIDDKVLVLIEQNTKILERYTQIAESQNKRLEHLEDMAHSPGSHTVGK